MYTSVRKPIWCVTVGTRKPVISTIFMASHNLSKVESKIYVPGTELELSYECKLIKTKRYNDYINIFYAVTVLEFGNGQNSNEAVASSGSETFDTWSHHRYAVKLSSAGAYRFAVRYLVNIP